MWASDHYLYDLRPERPYCRFSDELLTDTAVEYESPPPLEDMVYYTPTDYQTALDEARAASSS